MSNKSKKLFIFFLLIFSPIILFWLLAFFYGTIGNVTKHYRLYLNPGRKYASKLVKENRFINIPDAAEFSSIVANPVKTIPVIYTDDVVVGYDWDLSVTYIWSEPNVKYRLRGYVTKKQGGWVASSTSLYVQVTNPEVEKKLKSKESLQKLLDSVLKVKTYVLERAEYKPTRYYLFYIDKEGATRIFDIAGPFINNELKEKEIDYNFHIQLPGYIKK